MMASDRFPLIKFLVMSLQSQTDQRLTAPYTQRSKLSPPSQQPNTGKICTWLVDLFQKPKNKQISHLAGERKVNLDPACTSTTITPLFRLAMLICLVC